MVVSFNNILYKKLASIYHFYFLWCWLTDAVYEFIFTCRFTPWL